MAIAAYRYAGLYHLFLKILTYKPILCYEKTPFGKY
jgi:hypothetical protein